MDYLRLHAQLHPQKLAVNDLSFERTWSYSEFDDFVARCAAFLLGRGVTLGDRVAALSKNRAEIIVLHLACARVGAIFVPLNWRLSRLELDDLVSDCEPILIFGDGVSEEKGLAVEVISELEDQCRLFDPIELPGLPSDQVSLMLYTSGTTGRPKGVMLSELNLTETAINFSILGDVDSSSGFLCESPMFHIIGIVTSIRPPLLKGGHIVISDGFVPERTLERISDPELRISHYFCVPQMALSLRKAENYSPKLLRNIKAIFTGGAPHPAPQILAWLADGIPIVDGYGMSEAGTVFGMPLDIPMIADKAGCVGVATPRIHTRIVDEDNNAVAVGLPGELQLKGENVTKGYWRRELDFKNAKTVDGWFRTGDILTMDEDGYFRVTDRKKDMYITGGENVYPAEVEVHLLGYPGVSEFAVVGVANSKWGEVGCLFYVSEFVVVDIEDIEAYLENKLAKYKIPKIIRRVKTIPRNGVGKVLKHELCVNEVMING